MDNYERDGLTEQLAALGDVQAPPAIIPAVLRRVGLADAYFSLASPIGPVFVAYNERGIAAVMPAEDPTQFEAAFRARFDRAIYAAEQPPAALAKAVQEQLAGGRPKSLHFDLRGLSEFERHVLLKALEIPRGEIRPYAWIAAEIGHPQAVRAVGSALGRNPVPLLIPCHRVVRSDGSPGNYAFGAASKRALLAAEGVRLEQLAEWVSAGTRYHGSDTTRIFCYPTCHHALRISAEHRVAFRSGAEALAAGYRPCKVCRPALAA